MIVIYDHDRTYVKNSLADANSIVTSLYGEKLGEEAIKRLKNSRVGDTWRKNGGPLIAIVNKEKAEWIRKKESEIGML